MAYEFADKLPGFRNEFQMAYEFAHKLPDFRNEFQMAYNCRGCLIHSDRRSTWPMRFITNRSNSRLTRIKT